MKYALVYQGENARLLQVDSFSSNPQRRNARLVLSGRPNVVAQEAAVLPRRHNAVKTYHAGAGDVATMRWSEGPGKKSYYVVSSRKSNRAKGRIFREGKVDPAEPRDPTGGTAVTPKKRPWIDYHAYLKSDKWQIQRRAALSRALHRCQLCYSPGPLEVHHRTYKRLGEEAPQDLVVLCGRCHEVFHENRKLCR